MGQRKISNFELAYGAKTKKIDPETLKGAAKKLYNDLTEEQLKVYVARIEGTRVDINEKSHIKKSNVTMKVT